MALRKPKALKPGDLIRIVSPASPIAEAKLESALTFLRDEGYQVALAPHALEHDGFLAGSDKDRAADLMEAFCDPEVAAVFCSRGGYGCARLLPHLDLDAMAASEKMFLGFSDATTLHVALNKRGLVTLHAPMGITLSVEREPWVLESLSNALKGENPIPKEAPPAEKIVGGTAEGVVVGGCLCLIADSLATTEQIDVKDKILLIEDVDEPPHRVDAMLTHLINAGIAQQAAGFAVGEMTRTDEKADPAVGVKPWREIVIERLKPLGKPMVIGLPIGHAQNMLTLPLGIRARLNATNGTLEYLEPHCK